MYHMGGVWLDNRDVGDCVWLCMDTMMGNNIWIDGEYRCNVARIGKDGTETIGFSIIGGDQDILPNRPDRPRKEGWAWIRVSDGISQGLDGYSVFILYSLTTVLF